MNENSQTFVIINGFRSNPKEAEENAKRQALPVCNDPIQLLKLEETHQDTSVRAPAIVLDQMLRAKFKNDGIQEFMEIYTKLHVGEAFVLPIPPVVTCIFKEMSSPEDVQNFLSTSQRTIGQDAIGTFLNLHTDDVYEFTVIHANFDLAKEHNSIYHGYYYGEDENFALFIKSSAQFDITVVYSEK